MTRPSKPHPINKVTGTVFSKSKVKKSQATPRVPDCQYTVRRCDVPLNEVKKMTKEKLAQLMEHLQKEGEKWCDRKTGS